MDEIERSYEDQADWIIEILTSKAAIPSASTNALRAMREMARTADRLAVAVDALGQIAQESHWPLCRATTCPYCDARLALEAIRGR